MDAIRGIVDSWMPVFVLHMVEVSLFVLLVWGVDRFLKLPTRVRHLLWTLALAKTFIPPVFCVLDPVLEALPGYGAAGLLVPSAGIAQEPAGSVAPLLLPGAWASSVLVLTGAVLWRNVSLRRRLRAGTITPVRSRAIHRLLVGCRLEVYAASAIQSPMLVGLMHPRLYLPDTWRSWPDAHLKVIISHEANHVQNRDQFVLLLQTVSVILFGLSPLVWLMHRRLADLRELRCDEAAIVEIGVHPVRYSELLYRFVQGQSPQPLPSLTGTYFSESSRAVLERFSHILRLPEFGMLPPRLWQYSVLVLVSLAIVPLSFGDERTTLSFQGSTPATPRISKRRHLLYPPLVEDSSSQELPFFAVDAKPVLLEQSPPVYPAEARRRGLEGRVFVSFGVDTAGAVSGVRVIRGTTIFRQSAVDAVSRFLFRPARLRGKPVASRITMPITFKLTD